MLELTNYTYVLKKPIQIFFLAITFIICASSAYAGWWDSPALGSERGAATGNNTIINSPYFNSNLPTNGVSIYTPGAVSSYYGSPARPVPLGGSYFTIRSGSSALNFWRASSGYYYPWAYGGFSYAAPYYYQYGNQVIQVQPPLTTMFTDMQSYLDEAKSKGRLSNADYQHLNRRLHDLTGEAEDVSDNGDTPEQNADLRKEVNELGQEISHRIKPLS